MKAKWNFMNIDRTTLSFRKKVVLISFGLAIGCVSLWFTSSMARQLREKENYEVRLWALAIERLGQFNADDPLSAYIMDSRNNIPFIRTTDNFQRGAQFQPDSRPHSLPSRPAEPQAGTARAGESAFGNHGVERFAVLHILRQFASAENAHGLSVRTARRDSHLHRFRVPHLPQLAGG